MLTFYDNDFSTCAQKVRLLLCEKKATWNTVWLDLRAGDQLKPAYIALNPNGVVPTIVDDDQPVIESSLILQYLEENFPTEPAFLPGSAYGRYQARLLQQKIDTGLHAYIAVLSIGVAFRHELIETKGDKVGEHIDSIPNPVLREIWRGAVKNGLGDSRFIDALRGWHKALQDLETCLQSRNWLVENTYSIADMSYVPYLLRLEHLGLLKYMADDCPQVMRWLSQIRQRPAFRAAFTDVIKPEKIEFVQQCARHEAAAIQDANAKL